MNPSIEQSKVSPVTAVKRWSSSAVVMRESPRLPEITPACRCYGLKELARRAGVSRAFFENWKIDATPFETVVCFGGKEQRKIRFPHDASAGRLKSFDGKIPIARALWPSTGSVPSQQQDLILPFCDSSPSRQPLYEVSPNGDLHCRLDLLASIVLTLSRVEESLQPQSDEHGRFPASCSLAFREKFLERPILDEHGLAFQQALMTLLPGWTPDPPCFRLKLTHDVDDVGIPFSFRTAFSHSLKRRSPARSLRDIFAAASPVLPSELHLVCELAAISKSRALHSAFFWKASEQNRYDSGYPLHHPKVRRVVDDIRKNGFELGVHPGYDTFLNRQKLVPEADALKTTLGVPFPGGRQHYLRWCPQTWLDWESCRLRYDSSVGFADQFGFRAGTAFPFRPWCWQENRELDLIELPLILMDCTPVKYMRIGLPEGLERIRDLIRRVQQTGGVFTLLWHNTTLMDPVYAGWYEGILDLLDGAASYNLPETAAKLW